jgi:UDP-2,3-diacylglucosamine pyrophosphatase LpxH
MAFDAIVVSDIHLGSHVCQSKSLASFFSSIENKEIKTEKLIINGDLFDSWDFRKLNKDHWKILSQIRKISDNNKVIWISGNHDGPADMVSHLIGVDFVNEYSFTSGGKKILILHGDIFDNFISKYPVLTKIADIIYRWLQIYAGLQLSNLAKRSSKTFLRCSKEVCDRAKIYCYLKQCDKVICGHTHLATYDISDSISYYNCGCWTDNPCSYISIKDGETKINYVDIF